MFLQAHDCKPSDASDGLKSLNITLGVDERIPINLYERPLSAFVT